VTTVSQNSNQIAQLDPAEQQQDEKKNESYAKDAAWIVSPLPAALPPMEGCCEKHEDNEDQDDAEQILSSRNKTSADAPSEPTRFGTCELHNTE
jgi:hypothetical protein